MNIESFIGLSNAQNLIWEAFLEAFFQRFESLKRAAIESHTALWVSSVWLLYQVVYDVSPKQKILIKWTDIEAFLKEKGIKNYRHRIRIKLKVLYRLI